MRPLRTALTAGIAGIGWLLMAMLPAPVDAAEPAGDPNDPVYAYNQAVSQIQLEKWDEALLTVDTLIADRAQGAMQKYGPVFGHFYFLKGIILVGKKDPQGAIAAFKTCYETYTNDIFDTKTKEETAGLQRNQFRNAALVQWASVEMGEANYGGARDLFEKALAEGSRDKRVNLVHVAVNLGRCYLKSGDLEKGFDFMSRPLANEDLDDGLRETIFMVIAEDWSPMKDFAPVQAFLQAHRDVVDRDPFAERYERNPRFQFLAQKAIQANDPVRALAWYERMIDPRLLAPDYRKRHVALHNRSVPEGVEEMKQEALAELQTAIDALAREYFEIVNGIGSAYFLMKNFSASFAAFSRLSDQAGKHKDRPLYLHNAVVSAAQIDQWRGAYRYGRQFLDEFPGHELKPGVARVLVEVVFLREDYEEAYSISGEVRIDMKPGEEIRDIPDFVYGASAFHLGKVEESETEFEAYVKNYPKGQRLELVRFFLGLSKVRLSKWEQAAAVLNAFLADYPESALVSTVLFQCAMSEFMIDQPEASLAKIERLHKEFPGAESEASAWNLKADIFASEERSFEEIERAYLKGRDIADAAGQSEVAAYSLWQLVIQTSDVTAWDKAEAHYQEFQDKHGESDYRYDLLASALPVLVNQGRKDEGRDQLREIVWESRDQPESPVLAEMFGTYVDFLKENYTAEEFVAEMDALNKRPGITPTLNGWLTVARCATLEEQEAAADVINKFWYRLQAKFVPEQHSNYVIVQLARWISTQRKKPEEAKRLYDFVLQNRPGTANFDQALVDVAELQAESEDPEQREQAIEKFERVLAEFPADELSERAVLGMARIRMGDNNYPEAQQLWEKYLENRNWTLSRAEANYLLGYAMEKQGEIGDALKIYVSVYANFPGYLDWSTRAYLRTAAITKGRGQTLQALKILQDMLQRMGHHKHPGIAKGKELFLQWRGEYQPDPATQKS